MPKLKILDRYILIKFLGTYVFSNFIFLLIAIVIDITEKIDSFLNPKLSLYTIISDHYLNFVLFYGNLLSPIMVFISIIFVSSKLANNTEIVAILSSGVTFNRLLRPYTIGASIIAAGMLIMSHWIIPKSNEIRKSFEDKYVNRKVSGEKANRLYRQIRPNQFIFLDSYNQINKQGYQFAYDIFKNGKLKWSLKSEYIEWSDKDSLYKLTNYKKRIVFEKDDIISQGSHLDTLFSFKYNELIYSDYIAETMTYKELNKFLDKEKMKGAENLNAYLVERYKRTSIPLATYILVLIGVSLSSRKKRGGMGINIALGMGLVFIYIFFMQISNTFSVKANLTPILAVWLPNIVFGIISYYLYLNAKK